VVVADAHLGAADASGEEAFLDFLDTVPSLGDSLLLAGDVYDFWFTYRRLIPRHCIRVTSRIVELARRFPVLMIGGNHDRWGETFWGPETGVTFHARELRFAIGNRCVLAMHGDGVHKEHRVATVLNRVLNSRATITAFAALPSAIGFRLAKGLGHDPAYAAAHPEVVDLAVARQAAWAERELRRDPSIGTLVMAHTHRAALLEVAPGRYYVNPGAWLHERRYATIDQSGVELATFT
jgi:UDP-2,3-diacylglucosamine hydrolase